MNPMANPKAFYRGSEADLASGALELVAIVTPVPATYGLTAAQVTAYNTQATSFNTLLTTASSPSTRTPLVVDQKNTAKAILRKASADIASIITAIPTVTNSMLLALKLNQRVIPTPRPVPAEAPIVTVPSVNGRIANVRLKGAAPDSTRGKPFGAFSANIFTFVGDVAPTDPSAYTFQGSTTRTITQVQFPNTVPSGATVWICACWVSARGELGTGSVPISFTLQGGTVTGAVA
jgi:hypothetical protein